MLCIALLSLLAVGRKWIEGASRRSNSCVRLLRAGKLGAWRQVLPVSLTKVCARHDELRESTFPGFDKIVRANWSSGERRSRGNVTQDVR
ncbi:unnamed protein product [Pylaiella littoralis]